MKPPPTICRNIAALLLLILGAAIMVQCFTLTTLAQVAAYCFSGRLFTDTQFMTGGALDQPSLHKGLFLFAVSFGLAVPATFLALWVMDRPDLCVRAVFHAFSGPMLLTPLCFLSISLAHLVRYITAMGATPRRLLGLFVMLAGYVAWGAAVRFAWNFRETKMQ